MPGKSAKGKKGGKGRRGAKGRRPARKSMQTPEQASLSVKRTIVPASSPPYQCNSIYSVENVQLSQFDRAVTVASAYQFYRISGVRVTIKTPFDTYITNATEAYSRPNLYYMLDKAGVLGPATTLEQLKQMGARPKACDNKPTTIGWRPSVLTETDGLAGGLPSQYKISPWLNTTSNTVPHRGLFWFLDQQNIGLVPSPATGVPYYVELEVQFQFKKPLWQGSVAAAPFKSLLDGFIVAPLDGSSDGIVDHRNTFGVSSEPVEIVT